MTKAKYMQAELLLSALQKTQDSVLRDELRSAFINLPQFAQHHLSNDDIPMIELGWKKYFLGKTEMPFSSIQNIYSHIGWDNTQILIQIQELLDKRIISSVRQFDQDYHEYPLQLIFARYRLCSSFAYLIMNLNSTALISKALPEKLENFSDLRKAITKTFELIREYHWEANAEPQEMTCETPTLCYLDLLNPLIDLMLVADQIGVVRFLKSAELSRDELAIVVYLLYHWKYDCFVHTRDNLIRVIKTDQRSLSDFYHLFAQDSKLISNKILVECDDVYSSLAGNYRISFELRDMFDLPNTKNRQPAKNKRITTEDVLFDMDQPALFRIPVRQKLADLILPKKDMDLLRAAINRFQNGTYASLAEWGIYPPMDPGGLENKGLFMLLFGEPGTGKTFAAGAIASELGKELVGIDATLLRDLWYGNAEKFVRKIFQDMRRLSLEVTNPPIFLFNEVDQLIHKRAYGGSSIDATENAIQNIIMEEMENFPGIMIMTTNLIDNIDGAYFRRINIKLELTIPDLDCRVRLWENHLVSTIPGADKILIASLAKDYIFTGGQISLVIQNACNEAIMRKGKQRHLTLQDLIKYAKLEQPWTSRARHKPIGF